MLDTDIVYHLGLNPKGPEGELGIEIEMETNKFVEPTYVPTRWFCDYNEGSLKGDAVELVLKSPIMRDEVGHVIKFLKDKLAKNKVKIKNSIRAGIHVHVNMRGHTVGEVFKYMACYYPLETVLTNFCGDNRQGNLFCLRSRDALFSLQRAEQALESNNIHHLKTDLLRYSAFNLQSLFKYGTVEFRSLATESSLSNIERWCDIITRLKDYALGVEDSWQNISKISGWGPSEYLKSVVGEENFKVLYYEGMEEDIMEDTRNVQVLCNLLSKKGY